MTDISVQFHALPEETLLFVKELVCDFDVNLVAIQLRPFGVKKIDCTSIRSLLANEPMSRRFGFVLGDPDFRALNELDFADRNPDYLRLDIGAVTEKGLGQSWLSARTENGDAIKIWKMIAARLRRITKSGVTAVNPHTGATSRMKSFRYTAGAKALAEEGTPMLPIAGGSLLRFE